MRLLSLLFLFPSLLFMAVPISAAASCPGQPCVTVRFEGRDYAALHKREMFEGAPTDLYYYRIVDAGQPVSHLGEPLWGRFARWPAADHPVQSNVQTWHITWVRQGGAWVKSDVQGVRFEITPTPGAAEAAGRAMFEQALRERQAQDSALRQAQSAASGGASANTAPTTSRAFDVGQKEQLPPADGRKAYIAQRHCHFTSKNYADMARWFPGDSNYGLVEAVSVQIPKFITKPNYGDYYHFSYTLGGASAILTGPFPYEHAVRTLERWNREGNCWKPQTINVPRTDIRRPPLPPSMRSDEPYGQGR